jgi:hypothetical protein
MELRYSTTEVLVVKHVGKQLDKRAKAVLRLIRGARVSGKARRMFLRPQAVQVVLEGPVAIVNHTVEKGTNQPLLVAEVVSNQSLVLS